MEVTKPARTVEVCDFCQREGYLQPCDVCGRMFCLTHKGTVAGSWGFTTLCTECAGREDVGIVCAEYAKRLTPIFEERRIALRALRVEEGAER